jgi:putative acetyltransferase
LPDFAAIFTAPLLTIVNLAMHIQIDDLNGPQMAALLEHHMQNMHQLSPAECVFALDLSRLRQPDVTMWSAWEGDALLGCGALKQLDAGHGEIKSMRTDPAHLRKGVARAILETIMAEAARRGYQRLSLETGTHPAFGAAHKLYASVGFAFCGPFADYVVDPHSVFMSRAL